MATNMRMTITAIRTFIFMSFNHLNMSQYWSLKFHEVPYIWRRTLVAPRLNCKAPCCRSSVLLCKFSNFSPLWTTFSYLDQPRDQIEQGGGIRYYCAWFQWHHRLPFGFHESWEILRSWTFCGCWAFVCPLNLIGLFGTPRFECIKIEWKGYVMDIWAYVAIYTFLCVFHRAFSKVLVL